MNWNPMCSDEIFLLFAHSWQLLFMESIAHRSRDNSLKNEFKMINDADTANAEGDYKIRSEVITNTSTSQSIYDPYRKWLMRLLNAGADIFI